MNKKILFYKSIILFISTVFVFLLISCPSGSGGNPELEGFVSITGVLRVGEVLNADTSGLQGDGDIYYQWLQCDNEDGSFFNIEEASDSEYLLNESDLGKYFIVTVNRTGFSGSKTSGVAGPVAESLPNAIINSVNVIPANLTVERGKTQQFNAVISGINNPSQAVLWTVFGSDTGSKINNDGLLSAAIADKATELKVRATSVYDSTKYGEAIVTLKNPALTGIVTVSGTAQVGFTLTAVTDALNTDGLFTYEWQKSASQNNSFLPIANANASSYLLSAEDENYFIRVKVTSSFFSGEVISQERGPIGAPGAVIIINNVNINNKITEIERGKKHTYTVTVNGTGTIPQNVNWSVKGNFSSNTTLTGGVLTVSASEKSGTILTISAVSTFDENKFDTTTIKVINPELTGYVSILGAARVGETLNAITSSLDGIGTINFKWMNASFENGDFTVISNATFSNYLLTSNDSGKYIKLSVTRTDYEGKIESENIIGPVVMPTVTNVTINPAFASVTMSHNTMFSFTALVNGENNPPQTVAWEVTGGITGTTITSGILSISDNETAQELTVKAVSAFDTKKSDEVTVTILRNQLTGYVSISGFAQVGGTLTALVDNLAGTGNISYQWQRADNAIGNYTNIGGAVNKTYQLANEDKEKFIKVIVKRTGNKGEIASAPSDKTIPAPLETRTVEGTITVSKGIDYITINFLHQNQFDGISLPRGGVMTVEVDGIYQAYRWFVDGIEMLGETGKSLTLNGNDYSLGQHFILVLVYKNGIPYSPDNIRFIVE